jgi:hypothetical protein
MPTDINVANVGNRTAPHNRTSRRGILARGGAVLVGAAAVQTLSAQQKAYAVNPPQCCSGYNSCTYYGCSCFNPGKGGCCWYCINSQSCYTWQCCDRTCSGHNCICAFLICHCC